MYIAIPLWLPLALSSAAGGRVDFETPLVTCRVDYSHDGHSDFVVADSGDSRSLEHSGRIWVLSGVQGTVLAELAGDAKSSGFGHAVEEGADFDGDGTYDLAVVSYRSRSDSESVGLENIVTAYSGKSWKPLWQVKGPTATGFGSTIGCVGDQDHDSHPDLAVVDLAGHVQVFSGNTGKLLVEGGTQDETLQTESLLVADYDGDKVVDVLLHTPLIWPDDAESNPKAKPLAVSPVSVRSTQRGFVQISAITTGVSLDDLTDTIEHLGRGCDVDGDGFEDIVLGNGRMQCRHVARVRVASPKTGLTIRDIPAPPMSNHGFMDRFNRTFGYSACLSPRAKDSAIVIVGVPEYGRDASDAELAQLASGKLPHTSFGGIIWESESKVRCAYVSTGGALVYGVKSGNLEAVLSGDTNRDYFGASVQPSGDMDGDGLTDFVVTSGIVSSVRDAPKRNFYAQFYSGKTLGKLSRITCTETETPKLSR